MTTTRCAAGTPTACRPRIVWSRSASGADLTAPIVPLGVFARTSLLSVVAAWSLLVITVAAAAADPVTVRYPEGETHGFLVLRSLQGQDLEIGGVAGIFAKVAGKDLSRPCQPAQRPATPGGSSAPMPRCLKTLSVWHFSCSFLRPDALGTARRG